MSDLIENEVDKDLKILEYPQQKEEISLIKVVGKCTILKIIQYLVFLEILYILVSLYFPDYLSTNSKDFYFTSLKNIQSIKIGIQNLMPSNIFLLLKAQLLRKTPYTKHIVITFQTNSHYMCNYSDVNNHRLNVITFFDFNNDAITQKQTLINVPIDFYDSVIFSINFHVNYDEFQGIRLQISYINPHSWRFYYISLDAIADLTA